MIIKRRHNSRFSIVPNAIYEDRRLSLDTKAALGYLLSRPAHWQIRLEALQGALQVGRRSTQRIMRELIEAGYAERDDEQPRDENNHFSTYNYIIRDVPETGVAFLPQDRFVQRRRRGLKTCSDSKKEITKNLYPANPPLAPLELAEKKTARQRSHTDDVRPVQPLEGVVIDPIGEVSFDELARACAGDPGKLGPALALWRKLSPDDRRCVSNLIGPHGLELDGMWLSTWLLDRRWEKQRLATRASGFAGLAAELSAGADTITTYAEAYSEPWNAERARLVAAGESTALMDARARDGAGWTVRIADVFR